MEPTSVTVKILEQIRDAIGETNARVDQTNARLDQTNTRLDQNFEVLTNKIVEVEIRLSTAIAAVGGTLGQMTTLLRDRLNLRDRVDRCELDIHDLQVKTGIK